MVPEFSLDRNQVTRAAEEMLSRYGEDALGKLSIWAIGYKALGWGIHAQRCVLVGEAIKDMQSQANKTQATRTF